MYILTRLVSLLLMLCMVFGCYPAYADTEVTEATSEQTATTTVVLDLGTQPTSYTVVIPSTVKLDSNGTGSATVTLKSGFVLTEVTSLKVRATGGYSEYYFTQGTGGGASTTHYAYMTLRNSDNTSSLKCWLTPTNLNYTTDLISVTNQTDNTSDQNSTIQFNVEDTLPSYGKYTGTLTFTVTAA